MGEAEMRKPWQGGGGHKMFLLKSGRIPCSTLPDTASH